MAIPEKANISAHERYLRGLIASPHIHETIKNFCAGLIDRDMDGLVGQADIPEELMPQVNMLCLGLLTISFFNLTKPWGQDKILAKVQEIEDLIVLGEDGVEILKRYFEQELDEYVETSLSAAWEDEVLYGHAFLHIYRGDDNGNIPKNSEQWFAMKKDMTRKQRIAEEGLELSGYAVSTAIEIEQFKDILREAFLTHDFYSQLNLRNRQQGVLDVEIKLKGDYRCKLLHLATNNPSADVEIDDIPFNAFSLKLELNKGLKVVVMRTAYPLVGKRNMLNIVEGRGKAAAVA